MTQRTLWLEPLSAESFAPFGEVLEAKGAPDKIINDGQCGRFHDLACLEFTGGGARAGISLFRSRAWQLPYRLELMERHPFGSQAFVPMSADPFFLVVAPDANGAPGKPLAFLTQPGQGVNYRRNIWHGVLTPLIEHALFAVIDRAEGEEENLEKHLFAEPWFIRSAE